MAEFGQQWTVTTMFGPESHCQHEPVIIRYIQRNYYLEFTVTAYIPALIWLLSAVACNLIAKRRLLKKTAIKDMIVALIGPFAIPWVLIAKPEKS
jgi:hypothetical protein